MKPDPKPKKRQQKKALTIYEFRELYKGINKVKKTAPKKKKKSKWTIYQTKAWKVFRKYVMLYYSVDDMVQCSTSGIWLSILDKNMHCGHWLKTSDCQSVIFEFSNVMPQCYRENRHMGGRPDVMKQKLIEKFGEKEIERIYIKSKNFMKWDAFSLEIIEKEYTKKLEDLIKIKGDPWKK